MFFLNNYKHYKNIRFGSFEYALKEADKRSHKIIVETGVARGKTKFFFFTRHNWKDGMSTLLFAEYVSLNDGKLFSCDTSKRNIDNAKKFTKKFINYITFVNEDSVYYLNNINFKIDFLYLDSLDGHDPVRSSQHQLNEAKTAINKLHKNSLVLLDDKGLKTTKSLAFFLKNKFKIINETNEQILLGL